LIGKNPHGCWILTLSNAVIQRWFAKNEVHCVVAGSVHAGLSLPYRDLDHRAMCRHAAGVLLGLGHRKLAFVTAKSQQAGDLESDTGFVEGVQKSWHAGAEAYVCRHDGSVTGIDHALRRLMEQSLPPTAMLVANANHYLTVVSTLALMGRRVPQDVSVISRDDAPFLSYLVPTPARYTAGVQVLTRSLLRLVLQILSGDLTAQRGIRLMPEFIRGGSLAPPAQPRKP
jgi:LacI family transcriptional regulator